ncbi:polyprenyl diphosphate synthase [Streptomyces sp. NBC_00268]|uniref:polyprenyl diphosphate synthase n=1 Tax=Streptomyces sp. NBC_00268 TaxID=2975695 RepID=UPI002257AB63|nr:polyprenyl diphosphate synthase [Streptomyces sp. NBC_00268]MCX5182571.1 polyprenyl diphosphate synthase [Streptomyces sp. NBC_00268]
MTISTNPAPGAPARHIAFIADGNRRWAAARGVGTANGFQHGALAVRRALSHCRELGLEAASVFLMSSRNFHRDTEEVAVLVDVIAELLHDVADESTGPVRVLHNGALRGYATPQLLEAIEYVEATTVQRDGMAVCLGVGYNGHDEIRRAARQAATCPAYDPAVKLPIERYLTTAGLPDPDLIIRTSGERRLSGFLLWQATDSTLHFDDRWWPDYNRAALDEALAMHREQRRTFGR